MPRAQTNLGACYANGDGVPRDRDAARTWLQRGAEAGDPLGQRNLGTLLLGTDPAGGRCGIAGRRSRGTPSARTSSAACCSTARRAGRPAGGAALGGAGGAAGHRRRRARLGTMCHEAKGGPRDPAQAVHWWRVAAEAGDGDAAAMLGAALHMGQGVAADPVEAMAWLIVGSARRSILVRGFFARAEERLTADERVRARALAAQWGDAA